MKIFRLHLCCAVSSLLKIKALETTPVYPLLEELLRICHPYIILVCNMTFDLWLHNSKCGFGIVND